MSAADSTVLDRFAFVIPPLSSPLIFPQLRLDTAAACPPARPLSIHPTGTKRARPAADIDGGNSIHGRKKRRLRLQFITSRLSRPYSEPPSHIASRGNSKIAVWFRQALGTLPPPPPLRKAAVLNRVRMQARARHAEMPKKPRPNLHVVAGAFQSFTHRSEEWTGGDVRSKSSRGDKSGSGETQRTRQVHQFEGSVFRPSAISTSGVSNYDALDSDDDSSPGDEDTFGEPVGAGTNIVDFGVLMTPRPGGVGHDQTDVFAKSSQLATEAKGEELSLSVPEEKVVEILKENNPQKDLVLERTV